METLVRDCELQPTIPNFSNYSESVRWFKDKYNDYFIFKDSGNLGGEKVYIYHLITDRSGYSKGMEELDSKGFTSKGRELLTSYHIIIIMECGITHFIF